MKTRSIHPSRSVPASAAAGWLIASCSFACFVSACNGELAVVDDLDQQGSNLEHDGSGDPEEPAEPGDLTPPPPAAACNCALSPSLLALSCGAGEVLLLENDVVQQTADGGVAVFNVQLADRSYQILRWDGGASASASPVASGMLVGSSAVGDRVLTANGSVSLVDLVASTTTSFELSTIVGHGALTASGDTVVGVSYENDVAQLARANASTGDVEALGTVGDQITRAYVTPDGGTVVGFGGSLRPTRDNPLAGTDVAFRWNAAAGLTLGLPGAPAGVTVWPEAVSDDGSVVAGRSPTSKQHFRWTEAGGYTEIESASSRSGTTLSADGSVLLGSLVPAGGDSAAFRWTEATGAVNLTPGRTSLATDMSADGNVIVATSWEEDQNDGAAPDDTFIWDVEHGTRTLDEVLADRGVDTSGWEFGHARSLSDDGKVLLGIARCDGTQTLYRVVLSE